MRNFKYRAVAVIAAILVLPCLAFAQGNPQRFTGNITNLDRKAIFKLKTEINLVYTIDLESAAFDTFLEVRDAMGKIIATDDDGGNGLNSRLTFIPGKKATFQVVARPLRVGTGQFRLSIRPQKSLFAVSGELTKKDPFDRVRTNSHHKTHVLKLVAGNSYTIDLTSKKIDTYLRVEDANGVNLAHDDDSGGRLNSRLNFRPANTGNYRIIVTTFGGGVGDYTLVVRKN